MAYSKSELCNRLTFGECNEQTDKRLGELILYISHKMKDDPNFGATVLNKTLFYSDMWWFANTGKTLTGVQYQRLPMGPAPKRLKPVQDQLVRDEYLEILSVPRFKYTQKRTAALRDPEPGVFSPGELEMVDAVINVFRGANASDVSEFSHGLAWKTAKSGDLIPYEMAFLSDDEVDDADREWSRRVLGELRINA